MRVALDVGKFATDDLLHGYARADHMPTEPTISPQPVQNPGNAFRIVEYQFFIGTNILN